MLKTELVIVQQVFNSCNYTMTTYIVPKCALEYVRQLKQNL
jgi:hypothetical protein